MLKKILRKIAKLWTIFLKTRLLPSSLELGNASSNAYGKEKEGR